MQLQLVKILILLLSVVWIQEVAIAQENVEFNNNLLVIPSIDTTDQVGKYQNVIFGLSEEGTWQLRDFQETVQFPYIEHVEMVVTETFPVQVFLQVSGLFTGCGGLGTINKRLVGNQFEVSINEDSGLYTSPPIYTCTADLKPFSTTIALPVYDLDAGAYSYKVNGRVLSSGDVNSLTGTFEFIVDNKLAEN